MPAYMLRSLIGTLAAATSSSESRNRRADASKPPGCGPRHALVARQRCSKGAPRGTSQCARWRAAQPPRRSGRLACKHPDGEGKWAFSSPNDLRSHAGGEPSCRARTRGPRVEHATARHERRLSETAG
eukprot:scaffold269999_cov30-Tisochrysis_lutea.AAC.2